MPHLRLVGSWDDSPYFSSRGPLRGVTSVSVQLLISFFSSSPPLGSFPVFSDTTHPNPVVIISTDRSSAYLEPSARLWQKIPGPLWSPGPTPGPSTLTLLVLCTSSVSELSVELELSSPSAPAASSGYPHFILISHPEMLSVLALGRFSSLACWVSPAGLTCQTESCMWVSPLTKQTWNHPGPNPFLLTLKNYVGTPQISWKEQLI